MDVDKALIEILETFGVPVYRQGSMSNEAVYPATFITYWNSDSPDHAHYDNATFGTVWSFTVNVYSSDPDTPPTMIGQIRQALKEAGWIVQGKGYDVQSDEPTHTGRGIECEYLQF